jgi:hypothetical protein
MSTGPAKCDDVTALLLKPPPRKPRHSRPSLPPSSSRPWRRSGTGVLPVVAVNAQPLSRSPLSGHAPSVGPPRTRQRSMAPVTLSKLTGLSCTKQAPASALRVRLARRGAAVEAPSDLDGAAPDGRAVWTVFPRWHQRPDRSTIFEPKHLRRRPGAWSPVRDGQGPPPHRPARGLDRRRKPDPAGNARSTTSPSLRRRSATPSSSRPT